MPEETAAPSSTQQTTAAAPKATAKKKAAPKKTTAKKKAAEGTQHGRPSATAGKRITKLVKADETTMRKEGPVRSLFDSIRDGMTVEKYRENADDSAFALKVLRDFVARKYVKLS